MSTQSTEATDNRFAIIKQNIDNFAKEIVKCQCLEDIICELKNECCITDAFFNYIYELETTKTNKARSLLQNLLTKDFEAIDIFLKLLFKHDLKNLAEKIDPEFLATLSKQNSTDSLNNFVQNLPTMIPPVDIPPILVPSSESMNNFSRGISAKLEIKVTPVSEIYMQHPRKDVYKNCSQPRGYVFLANYKNFQNDEREVRRGSEIDVENLTELFTQMGYEVLEPYINLSKGQTIKALNNFRNDTRLADVDSCIVIIMSHGQRDKFFTSDNSYLEYNEVLDKFNNANCKLMMDKPKIFIFQCCRGTVADYGVEKPELCSLNYGIGNGTTHVESEVMLDGQSIGFTPSIENTSTLSDMFCVFAAIDGYASHRNPNTGSWLINALCKELMECAYCKDFSGLMYGVSAKLHDLVSSEGRRQQCECITKGVSKSFYFNPCPKDSSASFGSLSGLYDALPIPVRGREWFGSRSATPESPYALSPSPSMPSFRSRHGSDNSTTRDSSPFSPRNQCSPRDLAAAAYSFDRSKSAENYFLGGENCNPNTDDVVDTYTGGKRFEAPISEDYKSFRRHRVVPDEAERMDKSRFKRTLSQPSDSEAIKSANDIITYLQINEHEELIPLMSPIMDRLQTNKDRFKKSKKETASQ